MEEIKMSELSSVKVHVFNRAIQECIDEVACWKDLFVKNHESLLKDNLYKYPNEATREHENKDRFLANLIHKLEKKKIVEHFKQTQLSAD